jgi:hypothetical protein
VIEREWQQLRRKITNEGLGPENTESSNPVDSPRKKEGAGIVSVEMEREWQQLKRKITNEGLRPMYDTFQSTRRPVVEDGITDSVDDNLLTTPIIEDEVPEIEPLLVEPVCGDVVSPKVKVRADSDPGISRTPIASITAAPPTEVLLRDVAAILSSPSVDLGATGEYLAAPSESSDLESLQAMTSPISPEMRRGRHTMQYLVQAGLIAGTPGGTPAPTARVETDSSHFPSPHSPSRSLEAIFNGQASEEVGIGAEPVAASPVPKLDFPVRDDNKGAPEMNFVLRVPSSDYEQTVYFESPPRELDENAGMEYTHPNDIVHDPDDGNDCDRRSVFLASEGAGETTPTRRRTVGPGTHDSYLAEAYAEYEDMRPSEFISAPELVVGRTRTLGSCTGSDELLRLQTEHGYPLSGGTRSRGHSGSQSARTNSGSNSGRSLLKDGPSGSQSARKNDGHDAGTESLRLRDLSIGIASTNLEKFSSSPHNSPSRSNVPSSKLGLKRVTSDGALSSSFSNAASRSLLLAVGTGNDILKATSSSDKTGGDIESVNPTRQVTIKVAPTKATPAPSSPEPTSRRQSIKLIEYDIPRTFPTLAFFHDGGPLHVGFPYTF